MVLLKKQWMKTEFWFLLKQGKLIIQIPQRINIKYSKFLNAKVLKKNMAANPKNDHIKVKTVVCQDIEDNTKTPEDSMCTKNPSSERSKDEENSWSLRRVEHEESGSSIESDVRKYRSSCTEDEEVQYEISSVKRDKGESGTTLNDYSVIESNSIECCYTSNITSSRDIVPVAIPQEEDVEEYALNPNINPPEGATVDHGAAIIQKNCDISEKHLLWKEVDEEGDNLTREHVDMRHDVCGSTEQEVDPNNRKWVPSFKTETEPKQKIENSRINDSVNNTSQEHKIKLNAEIMRQHNDLHREANQIETPYKGKSSKKSTPMSSADTDVLSIQEHSSKIRKSQRGLEYGQASQDLEDLRKTIEMTKERRMDKVTEKTKERKAVRFYRGSITNALRELRMLQEILGQKENISVPPSCNESSIRSDLSEEKSKNEFEGLCMVERREMANLMKENNSRFLLPGLRQEYSSIGQLKETMDDIGSAFYDNESQNQFIIKALEEGLNETKNKLIETEERERSLQTALQDMQQEKNKLQQHYSKTLEESLNKEKAEELRREIEKLKLQLREGDRKIEQLEKKEETTTEENIELRMNLLKIQEELTKQNYHKDSVIEERDTQIAELEREIKSLSDLRLKNEEAQQEQSKKIEELEKKQAKTLAAKTLEIRQEADCQLAELNIKIACQEEELIRLRRENSELGTRLKSSENICSVSSQDDILENQENLAWLESPLSSPNSGETSRLKKRVEEAESKAKENQDRADYLYLLLNQKLVELNKLQLTLSSQTKELIHLEKAALPTSMSS
ncbi:uncharacterized protein LOC143255438 isoform X2 [Tachypleus tridentatus]|uniref:uncharacterized protein LOC143255438 isoform X2 n=1 Tax=Tachypleus tridentatus TaxID=6853 RepID=UPI003FD5CB59